MMATRVQATCTRTFASRPVPYKKLARVSVDLVQVVSCASFLHRFLVQVS